jgi:hypothetical protein
MKKQRIIPSLAIPVADGSEKITLVSHTPALSPRIRYEDLTGTITRHHVGKGVSLAPRIPAAVPRARMHRARRGAGSTRRSDR